MTFVEFFDETSVDNLYSCLTTVPDRVVLLGCNGNLMEKYAAIYKGIFLDRGFDVDFVCRSLPKNNMEGILERLVEILETYDDCYFDATGGDDIYLVALGILSQKYPEKNVQIHRYNVTNGAVTDCDLDGNVVEAQYMAGLTVDECIRANGARVVYDDEKPGTTYRWNITEQFMWDIASAWEICKENPSRWNDTVSTFALIDSKRDETLEDNVVVASTEEVKDYCASKKKQFGIDTVFVQKISNAGLLRYYEFTDERIVLEFKSADVRRLLTMAGRTLEMKIFMECLILADKKGEYIYDDVVNGVYIDWDGRVNSVAGPEGYYVDAENEIDVVLMHGIIPVFISCKNGNVEKDEPYKLSVVASKFGGKYAKKVLITSEDDEYEAREASYRQRYKEMGIVHIGPVSKMDDETLRKQLSTLWSR